MIQRRDDLEDLLDRIGWLYEEGKAEEAAREVRRGRRRFPDDLTLREWEATLAGDEGRHREALEILEEVLRAEPGRRFSQREKTAALIGLGRFEEARGLLEEIGPEDKKDAGFHFDLALCLDRLGKTAEADRAFTRAARLDPDSFQRPVRLSQEEFDETVRKAMDEVPAKLRPYLANVIVEVADYPSCPPLEKGIDPFLLGLYVGLPRTQRSHEDRDHLDRIFIFKRNLEIEFPASGDLKEEIRKTVIHEAAHHFGLGEEDMGDYA